MSADKIKDGVSAYRCGEDRYYTVDTGGRKTIIGGTEGEYTAEAEDAAAVVLLTSKPDSSASLSGLLKKRADIDVYASAAGLRNIKEIVNSDVNEMLIKDGSAPGELNGIEFSVTPGLPWMDSVTAMYNGILFSGELFSGFDGSWESFDGYYKENLSVNIDFVRAALEKLKGKRTDVICPSKGEVLTGEDVGEAFRRYEDLTRIVQKNERTAVILYASRYGCTREMAECAAGVLRHGFKTVLIDVYSETREYASAAAASADVLLVGTHTINRNAPVQIWDAVTSLDLVNKRRVPYLVFGSYGWAGDGIKLIHKTLSAMGMKAAAKPVEVLFKPDENDLGKLRRCLVDNILSNQEL